MNADKRIVLIAPILPFRGGIAQHATMLKRALAEKSDLLALSYSRQYPGWLFPGESDQDPDYVDYQEPKTQYLLDSLNPISWWRSAKRVTAFDPDLIILPWWTVYWAPCYWVLIRLLGPVYRRRLLFLCHNVVDHEEGVLKRLASFAVLHRSRHFLVHTRSEADRLIAMVPHAQVSVIPHPIYDQFPAPTKVWPRRAGLELLFFGFVRPYKGLDILLDALGKLAGYGETDVQLSIVGEFWQGLEACKEHIQRLGLCGQVELVPGYISEQGAANYFQRADFVVLPYRSASGSGIVALAYHYDTPVIVTKVGGLTDVVTDGQTGLLVEPDSAADLAVAISRARGFDTIPEAFASVKQSLSWDVLAAELLRIAEQTKHPPEAPCSSSP